MAESNYEKTKRACAQAFCETDHSALIERFGLEQDADYLYVRFFEQPFRLGKRTGVIERREECEAVGAHATPDASVGATEASAAAPGAPTTGTTASVATPNASAKNIWSEAQFNETMTIYDLLGYAQPSCHASGTMVNMKSLHTKIAATAPQPSSIYAA